MTEGGEQNEMKTQGEICISVTENILLNTTLSVQYMKYSSAINNYNMLSVCACTVCVSICSISSHLCVLFSCITSRS